MTRSGTCSEPGIFAGSEITELCEAIKDIHRLLASVGDFLVELDGADAPGGNGLQVDFKRWGVRTIAEDLLARQYEKLDRIVAIYRQEQEKMSEGRGPRPVEGHPVLRQ